MKSCFFIGHRDAPESIFSAIRSAVEHHITNLGVTGFIVGHYGRFDSMAAQAVIAAKKQHPHVTLTMLLPYHPSTHPYAIADGFDGSHYPPDPDRVPAHAAIIRANRYTIDHCDYLIFYVRYAAGNASCMVEYAKAREAKGLLRITGIADKNE